MPLKVPVPSVSANHFVAEKETNAVFLLPSPQYCCLHCSFVVVMQGSFVVVMQGDHHKMICC